MSFPLKYFGDGKYEMWSVIFLMCQYIYRMLHVVMHSIIRSFGRLKQDDLEFINSLGNIVRSCFKKVKPQTNRKPKRSFHSAQTPAGDHRCVFPKHVNIVDTV
jgi:hypothetical protein